jgi:hypothetical protein
MAGKLKINEKVVDGKTGYQVIGSDGTTTKWHGSPQGARRELGRLKSAKKSKEKKKRRETSSNYSNYQKLYGNMLKKGKTRKDYKGESI